MSSGWLIPTDSEKAGNLDWLIMTGSGKVDLMVERIPTDSETAVSSGWLTNLGPLKAERMACQRWTGPEMA